ncbi:MAG: TPM domain-containing protein [Spirosomaceae bacterium]|nr:TPM domain-containing protein [Spirosomataceae bacterium]
MFLTEEQQKLIVEAIKEAELATSGEVKVHVEEKCPADDPVKRATKLFSYLALHKTAQRNGVLFYLAYGDRKFAVIGDEGIDKAVTALFWDSTKEILRNHFAKEQYTEGLCAGINEAGKQLKKYFPYQSDDKNELSDDISFG